MIERTQRQGAATSAASQNTATPAGAPAEAALVGDHALASQAPHGIEPLPGGLDGVPMLHSNHPEILHGPGITVSTLDGSGPAHLSHRFTGTFEVFCHHQNRAGRPLYQAVVLHNPETQPVTVAVGPSASYSTDEAPYQDGPAEAQADPTGSLVSGPGDAVSAALLRGERTVPDASVTLAPGETRILHSRVIPPRNEATSEFKLDAGGPVQAAVVILDQPPTPRAVQDTLAAGKLVARNPGDLPPTPPGAPGPIVYGRVAGIQSASTWQGRLAPVGQAIAVDAPVERQWIVDAKQGHDGGTGQVQSSPLLARYADAAYAAHGNYGVQYDLTVPLANGGNTPRQVSLYLDSLPEPGAPTPSPPPPAPVGWLVGLLMPLRAWLPLELNAGVSRAFRGEVAVDVTAPDGSTETHYVHVSQTPGQRADTPIASVKVPPGGARDVRVRFYYPADATAPQVLRLEAAP